MSSPSTAAARASLNICRVPSLPPPPPTETESLASLKHRGPVATDLPALTAPRPPPKAHSDFTLFPSSRRGLAAWTGGRC
ncbi:uncharacterized protein ColSpa_02613 [Colletotrichum spaethianum]|uniref:Uncharacterized protein n=1 Tax=Colletotrichum spaethianum TaxID=700344 RepID=A0AA37LDV6_9PEZI|nr:uncharacterized protein ColSpa_02613 [Colletotrichum spaethianum]GKT42432.1 hypothetical protein ColSpa_02613 [Colletotrichum spaethianum]